MKRVYFSNIFRHEYSACASRPTIKTNFFSIKNDCFIWLVVTFILLSSYTQAQNKITGKITDQNNMPLSGVSIFIPDLNKGTISNSNGTYELSNLPDGRMKIQYSALGYATHIETVELMDKSIELNIILNQTAIEMDEIVVSSGYNNTQHENAVKIDILKLNPLTTKSTPNFTEIITQVPGVDMISKGSGVSKPVIRGLSMNDILVLNNGVRFENYQYSDHHPLGIDEFGIENIEIIKGPASLLYGSDAIGGVINFIREKPAPIGSIAGDYNLQLFSNSLGITNNLGIKGASNKFFGGIRIGQKSNADYLQGGGTIVPNSRANDIALKANAGYTNKVGIFKLFYDFSNQKSGLVEDEAVETITTRGRKNTSWYQEFNTHLISSQNKIYLGNYKMDLNSALQNTELTHFGDAGTYEIQMQLTTLTYEAKLYLPSSENAEYIVGFQGMHQKNKNLNDRETKLLPDATTNNYSGFALLQYNFFKKLKLQTGIRYDNKLITSQAIGLPTDSAYRAPIDKSYGSFSGSLGATYSFTDDLLLRTNFAAAYRTPNLAELTSNGLHELRYEIGDKNLVPQNAYETDLSIHYHRDNFTFDVAGFYNMIHNYIFIAPTGDTTASGINIYQYRQANSFLYGGEAGFHFHPKTLSWLHIESSFSYVVGKQKNGNFLPFVPAHKLHFELRGEKENLIFLKNAFASIHTNIAFDQNNVAPDETPTPGYTIFELSLGGNIKMKNLPIT
ncbi:MAG: TonB-dependent receptor, partial [Bacteroidales bacterium]